MYQFPGYVLSIDHVQGILFASPSKVSVHVKGKTAAFPQRLYRGAHQRIALQDELDEAVRETGGAVCVQGERAREKAASSP